MGRLHAMAGKAGDSRYTAGKAGAVAVLAGGKSGCPGLYIGAMGRGTGPSGRMTAGDRIDH